jgi:hypothetical protein
VAGWQSRGIPQSGMHRYKTGFISAPVISIPDLHSCTWCYMGLDSGSNSAFRAKDGVPHCKCIRVWVFVFLLLFTSGSQFLLVIKQDLRFTGQIQSQQIVSCVVKTSLVDFEYGVGSFLTGLDALYAGFTADTAGGIWLVWRWCWWVG